MAKLKMYIRHRKYFVGDEIEYRVFNEIRHGTVIKAPDTYYCYCDSHTYSIDYYIVSDDEERQMRNDREQILIPQYHLISVSSINGKIE